MQNPLKVENLFFVSLTIQIKGIMSFVMKENEMGSKIPKAPRAFISTNVAISTQEILDFYVERWSIEVFFRQCKNTLALDSYQIRSVKGIKRYWLLMSLAYYIACTSVDTKSSSSFDEFRKMAGYFFYFFLLLFIFPKISNHINCMIMHFALMISIQNPI